jgi:hypothetical protein
MWFKKIESHLLSEIFDWNPHILTPLHIIESVCLQGVLFSDDVLLSSDIRRYVGTNEIIKKTVRNSKVASEMCW